MNRTLKYNYLPRGKNITLSHLVTILVEEFLPEMLQKYQKQNFAMSESYRSYNDFVPKYLQGRPRSVILHCLARIRKAEKFTKESVQQIDTAGHFKVKSLSGKQHTVQFTTDNHTPECTCKDWTRWHIPCKHFFAIFTYFPHWGWTSLPKEYLENEYLCADSAVLTNLSNSDGNSLAPTDSGHVCDSPSPDNLDGEETMDFNHDLPQRHVSVLAHV